MNDDYSQTTRDIRVRVRSFYLEDQSNPADGNYVWAYRIRIDNLGAVAVRLLRRSWHITDGRGRTQDVEGAGVIGQTPQLAPGETVEYMSGTPLDTPSGFMTGRYQMIDIDTGEAFDVAIPTFSLDSPHQPGGVH